MDKGMLIRELAAIIGVTEDTVINWEMRDIQPKEESMARIKEFIEKNPFNN